MTPTSRVTEPSRASRPSWVSGPSRASRPSWVSGPSRARRRAAARFASLVALVTLLAVGFGVGGAAEQGAIAAAGAGWGVAAPAAAMVATAVLLLALVPRTLLAAAAGLLFGPVTGAACLIAGATIGAATAFGLGRWLGRDFVAAQARVRRADRWITRGGVLGVLALRLLPIAPFGLVSYALGTSGVRLAAYLAGTVLGMLPSTIVYANLGAAATRPGSAAFGFSLAGVLMLGLGTALAATWIARTRREPGWSPAPVSRQEPVSRRVPD